MVSVRRGAYEPTRQEAETQARHNMPFSELVERLQTDPKEVEPSIEKAKQKKPAAKRKPKQKKP
jgi:hypothetical protein